LKCKTGSQTVGLFDIEKQNIAVEVYGFSLDSTTLQKAT